MARTRDNKELYRTAIPIEMPGGVRPYNRTAGRADDLDHSLSQAKDVDVVDVQNLVNFHVSVLCLLTKHRVIYRVLFRKCPIHIKIKQFPLILKVQLRYLDGVRRIPGRNRF